MLEVEGLDDRVLARKMSISFSPEDCVFDKYYLFFHDGTPTP